jgi:hypothetical protein
LAKTGTKPQKPARKAGRHQAVILPTIHNGLLRLAKKVAWLQADSSQKMLTVCPAVVRAQDAEAALPTTATKPRSRARKVARLRAVGNPAMRIDRPAAAREVVAAVTLPTTEIKPQKQGAKEVNKALVADVNSDEV